MLFCTVVIPTGQNRLSILRFILHQHRRVEIDYGSEWNIAVGRGAAISSKRQAGAVQSSGRWAEPAGHAQVHGDALKGPQPVRPHQQGKEKLR